ncbi:ABC transporter ATP-binding protein [Eisenibacter elegans]|jgi:subfamily B ATP-binding cassette protein MsbA|uniref:ABC transporter ATP-binding protein n=1 Tax=Eisenibacter elegans TaxID=997 RepID=UPI0003F89CAB|nr:ABC transporter ATP-binding protein [Eisenibacter elegans]
MKTFFRILSYGKPLNRYIIPYFLFSLLYSVFSLANFGLLVPLLDVLFSDTSVAAQTAAPFPEASFSPRYVIDVFYYYFYHYIRTYGAFSTLQFVCGIFILAMILSNICLYFSIRVMEYMRVQVVENLRRDFFTKITQLHLGYFSDQRKGDIMARMTTDAVEVEAMAMNTLRMIFKDPLKIILFFIGLFVISVKLTLFTLVFIPLSSLLVAYVINKLKRKADYTQQILGNMGSILDETIGGLRVIKAFNAGPYIRGVFEAQNQAYSRTMRSLARTREAASPLSEVLGTTIVAGILLYGGSLVLSDQSELKASQFVAYITLFWQIMQPAKSLTSAFSVVQKGIAAGDRIFAVLDTPLAITDKPEATPLKAFEEGITFENVSFRYEDNWVLKDISFSIPKGKTVALVGETGSGKSTIADLIPRFYDVQSGAIRIDGHDIRDLQWETIMQNLGIVTQDAILFHDTIYNNIAFGSPHATREEVERAAQIANAHEFILHAEQGYQTVIGDRGVKLSGGQRQRITIARAILKNPPILILDEATSALDAGSEKLVQEALDNLMQNRTSLVIAHRLSTIQNADEILVLRQGEIIERGTHESLLRNQDGVYRKFKHMQTL